MDTELMLDVGQANELKLAFRRGGWTNADVKRLCEDNLTAQVLPIIRGLAEIVVVKHVIDCDADPFLPKGWTVESHKKGGSFEWDPAKVRFHLSENQKNGKRIEGSELQEELANESVLNANVLDYLLSHTELIPKEWKGKFVFFWGTVYRYLGGHPYVRYLSWDGGRWLWDYRWLGGDWYDGSPAACSQVSS